MQSGLDLPLARRRRLVGKHAQWPDRCRADRGLLVLRLLGLRRRRLYLRRHAQHADLERRGRRQQLVHCRQLQRHLAHCRPLASLRSLAGGGHTANNNDLAANSLFYGIFFDAAAPSYNLQGNAIQLSGDVLNQSGTNQSIGLNIQLVPGDGAFNTNTITFDTGAKNITDSGSISGSGMALMKTGSGILILSGTNTYNGGTIVTAGKLIVATPSAILDGTSLTVRDERPTKFAAPVIGAPAVSVESSPAPVPEPGALSLLAALLVSAAAWRVVRKP